MINQSNTTASELKTIICKRLHGWEASTDTVENGEGWRVSTSKGYSGTILSTAKKGTFYNGNFSFEMFGGKSLKLINEKGRATEKSVQEQHARALILFAEQTADEQEAYKIEVGQMICFIGYESNERPEIAIYEIKKGSFGLTYKTINTRTKELGRTEHLKDLDDKFGIGSYYIKGLKFEDLDELNQMVLEAKEAEQEAEKAEQEERERLKAENLAKIEEGKKLINIPSWAQSVIVADRYQNDSDSMTDYFSTSVVQTVIIGFSKHKKNNMQELKNACLNWEVSAELLNEEDNEHTKGGAYLPDYFIGSSSWSGWKVNKRKYGIDPQTEEGKNFIYGAVADGLFFANTEEQTEQESPNFEAVEVPAGQIQIIDYSEKAIAVIGETKPIKDQLKALGGRFNFRLSCGAGWIFPKTKLEELEAFLSA